MYAIIKTGSQQHQVRVHSIIEVNRLALDAGAAFETEQVLLLGGEKQETLVGAPYVSGARVKGTIINHYRDRKVLVFKQKRRKNYKRTRGHRQEMTRVRIDSIEAK